MRQRLIYFLALTLSVFVLWAGCSVEAIVLSSKDGEHTLTYDASAFEPQARTREDIQILQRYVRDAASQFRKDGDVVALSELLSAAKTRDYRRLERIIYEYEKKKQEGE
jgi:hypothetical protein